MSKVIYLVLLFLAMSACALAGDWLPEYLLASNPPGDIQPFDLRLAIDQSNCVHAHYTVYMWDVRYVKSDFDGNILIPDVSVFSGSAHSDVAVDASGNVHFAISHAGELWYKKNDSNGGVLVPETQISFMESGNVHNAMDIDSYGNLHIVVWNFHDPLGGGFYFKLDNIGNVLIGPQSFSSGGGGFCDAWIDVDAFDNVHICWYDQYCKMNYTGSVLIPAMSISDMPGSGGWSKVSSDSNGRAHVVWRDDRHGNGEIYYSRINVSGGFDINSFRMTYNDSASFWPSVVVDWDNHAHVVWNDSRNGPNSSKDIYYSKLDADGLILVDNQLLSTSSSDCYVSDITLDNFGNPVIIHTHDQNVYFMRQQPVGDPYLVGYWKFEEDDGATAADSSAYGNHGTLIGEPLRVEGLPLLGQALKLNGVNEHVRVADVPSLQMTGPFTIMAWINPETIPVNAQIASFINKWLNYILQTGAGGGLPGRLRVVAQNSEGTWHPLESDSVLVANRWQHAVGVWDGDSLRLYYNGQQVASRYLASFTPGPHSPQDLYIGSEKGSCQFFDGLIDEVKIYRRAFTSNEINEEFQSGFVCGDADVSGEVDIDDVVYLIAYIFSGGPEPAPYESGDVDCSGGVDIDDVVYLIAYIFSGGPPPCEPVE